MDTKANQVPYNIPADAVWFSKPPPLDISIAGYN